MKTLTGPTLVLALALVGACANVPLTPNHQPASVRPVPSSDGWSGSTRAGREPVLYARDGTPVERGSEGELTTTGEVGQPPRGIQNEGAASRPYMLELYQTAVQRGDDLALEVEALDQRLRQAELREGELQASIVRLENQVAQLTEERDRIQAQSFELAGRLTTAQIRRLEAEKLLLETVLEQNRQQAKATEIEAATGAAAPHFAQRPSPRAQEPQ